MPLKRFELNHHERSSGSLDRITTDFASPRLIFPNLINLSPSVTSAAEISRSSWIGCLPPGIDIRALAGAYHRKCRSNRPLLAVHNCTAPP
jgi:hypothetical protein